MTIRAGSGSGSGVGVPEPCLADCSDEEEEPLEESACFYGAVSRETAEWILWERGCPDGLYLLRRSGPDYVLSLCFERSVLHYRIRRLSGAGVELCGLPGQQFRDPWSLLQDVQGLATRPTLPCNRARDAMLPPTHWGLADDAVKAFMLLKARQWGMDEAQLDSPRAEAPSGSVGDLRSLLSKTLHEIQPWFHGPLSRADAERRLQDAGHLDGKFLVRERDDSSYALCLSHGGSVKHYKVDVTPAGEFAIQDGQRFPSIMSLISHYTLFSDGLWCPLTEACVRPDCVLAQPTANRGPQQLRGSPGSRLLGTLGSARVGILNRLVASISPQQVMERSRTMPRLRAPSRLSCSSPPPSSAAPAAKPEPRRQSAASRLHKASSFDHLLPGFISYLFSGDSDGDRKTMRRKSSGPKRLPEMEHTLPRGLGSASATRELPCPLAPSPRRGWPSGPPPPPPRPVPAPRHSLVRRDYHDPGPVYANNEALSARAAQLQQLQCADDGDRIPEEQEEDGSCEGALIDLDCGDCVAAVCRRSASSPSVGSRALILSDLDSFPQPMPPPDGARSPSPTLILFSECGDLEEGPYEEIDTASLSDSATLAGSDGSGSPPQGDLIDMDTLEVRSKGKGTNLERSLSEPSSPDRYLPTTGVDGGSKPWLSKEESESAYQAMKRFCSGPMSLDPKSIVLKDKIGVGNFGEVHRAVFGSGPVEVQFAVKMLKETLVGSHKEEIMNEAQTMSQLDHPHIVRLVGLSQGQALMLVMELAPLGPLNRFLKLNREQLDPSRVLSLALQVGGAMEYLEARSLVHRDLAARNVLLVNDRFAKISDFGMTRALGLGKDYYKAQAAGKWPLKWYAPECIYFFKFSTKSDVWSFGVTLWEAMSYGERPYQGMTGQTILAMLESDHRLEKPKDCPDGVYELMRDCWHYRPDDRPTFTEVCSALRTALESCS